MEKESDYTLRLEFLDALQKFRDKEFVSTTANIFRKVINSSEEKQERIAALKYLGEFASEDALKTAEELLTISTEDEIVSASIDILKKFGDRKSKLALLTFKANNKNEAFGTKIDDAIKTIELREPK